MSALPLSSSALRSGSSRIFRSWRWNASFSHPLTWGPRTTLKGTNWKMVRWVAGTSGRDRPLTSRGTSREAISWLGAKLTMPSSSSRRSTPYSRSTRRAVAKSRRGRQRLGELQRDQVRLLPQARGDDEGHAELLAEDLVDEGDQRHVVEAHPDGVAGEVLAQAVRDPLRHRALDDHARRPGGAQPVAGAPRAAQGRLPRTPRSRRAAPSAAGSDPGGDRPAGSSTRSRAMGSALPRTGGGGGPLSWRGLGVQAELLPDPPPEVGLVGTRQRRRHQGVA